MVASTQIRDASFSFSKAFSRYIVLPRVKIVSLWLVSIWMDSEINMLTKCSLSLEFVKVQPIAHFFFFFFAPSCSEALQQDKHPAVNLQVQTTAQRKTQSDSRQTSSCVILAFHRTPRHTPPPPPWSVFFKRQADNTSTCVCVCVLFVFQLCELFSHSRQK